MRVAAVDCGGTGLRVGLCERAEDARIDDERDTPARADEIPGAIIAALAEQEGGLDGIGIGIAGLIDHHAGVLAWMPHRPGTDVPVARLVAETMGVPVVVDNDANMAGLAEAVIGAGQGKRFVLTLTVGTGIGAGVTIGGRVEHGRAFLGEVGHMRFDPSGPLCRCGLTGCWESMASGTALDRAASEHVAAFPDGAVAALAAGSDPRGAHLAAAAAEGDQAAAASLVAVARAFGEGLADLVAILDPDVIVAGGGVVAAVGERFLVPARDAMMSALSGRGSRPETPVVAARFGARSGLVGAALAARGGRGE